VGGRVGALGGAIALRGRSDLVRLGAWIVFWACAAWTASVVAGLIPAMPLVALAPGALLATALVAARAPLLIVLALVLLGGTYSRLQHDYGAEPYLFMHGLLGGLWIAAVWTLVRREPRPRLAPELLGLAGIAVLALAWVGLDEQPYEALKSWRQVYWAMLAAPLVALLPWPAARSGRLAIARLAGGAAVTAYSIYRWQLGDPAAERVFALTFGAGYNFIGGEVRPVGGVGDAHALSALLAPLVVFSFALALSLSGVWRRLLAAATLAGAATLLVASDVRAGMLAALAGVVVVLVLLVAARSLGGRRLAAAYIGLLLCAGVIGSVAALGTDDGGERAQRLEAILAPEDDPAFQSRLYAWEGALAEIDERPFGRGLGTAEGGRERSFANQSGSLQGDAVNSYLRLALEQGALMTVLVIVALLAILAGLARAALTATRPAASAIAVAAAGTLVTFAVQLNFESIYIGIGTVLLPWLIVGLGLRTLCWPRGEP
jgi:O-antigen ligase